MEGMEGFSEEMITAGKSVRILWTCDEITNIGFGNFTGLSSDILVGNIFYHIYRALP
jgi:hypothetical protein